MREEDLRYLSRGQLNGIIIEQAEIISHLRNKLHILDRRSLILDEPYELRDPSSRTTQDILDELGIGYTVVSNIVYTQGSLD